MIKARLEKYKKQILIRNLITLSLLLVLGYASYGLLFRDSLSDFKVLLILLATFVLVMVTRKNESIKKIRITDIITKDCDADTWLFYCENYGNQKRNVWKINYINALNLVGQLERAKNELDVLNYDKLSKKEKLAYLLIQNDNFFFLSDMEGLFSVQVSLKAFKQDNALIKSKIQLNKAYIDSLKKECHYYENKVQIEGNIESTMLSKIKLAYVNYLNLTSSGNILEAEKIRQFILTNGGTLFFVKEIQK